jgi:hypothetical protein
MEKQVKEFKCDICGATFKDEKALLKHRLIHMTMENRVPEEEQNVQTSTPVPPPKRLPQPVPAPEPHPQSLQI